MDATSAARSTAARYLAPLGLLLLCNPTNQAFAFTPDLHAAFAEQAAQAYGTCEGAALPEPLAKALADGTKAEDSSPRTFIQRATHWHFYNRNQALKPFWFFNRNLDEIFATRIEALNDLLKDPDADPEKVYEQAGRVLHYIQDMSVPGHVLPAYHAKLPGNEPDPFDEFASIDALPTFKLEQAECQALGGKAAAKDITPQDFLTAAATQTLQAIEQIDAHGNPIVDGAWSAYWEYPARNADDAANGWGQYGECKFIKGTGKANCKSDQALTALYEQQTKQAMSNSVLMLFYLQQRLDKTRGKVVVR